MFWLKKLRSVFGNDEKQKSIDKGKNVAPPKKYGDDVVLLNFNEYRYKVKGGMWENLIKWSNTFRWQGEGKEAFGLVDRNRREGILPVFLGKVEDGKGVSLDFEGRHTLVCGTSTWGKTNFLRQFLIELMHWNHPDYLKIFVMDGKQKSFLDAKNIINIKGGYEESKESINFFSEEIERRKKIFPIYGCMKLKEALAKSGVTEKTPPYIVIFLDEYAYFLTQAKRKGELAKLTEKIEEIASQGLAYGITMIFSTQTPMAKILDGMVKNNIETRIFFNMSEVRAWQYLGSGLKEKTKLMKRGEFLAATENGIVRARTILVRDEVFKVACRNIEKSGKDFRIFK